jgi:hypothetical protein
LAGNVRGHYNSKNYLISFVNGKPQTTSYSGDIFYGCNPETGIFANGYGGMGHYLITVSRLNSDGTVTTIHKIDVSFGDTENNKVVYYIKVDEGNKHYFNTENAMNADLESMLGNYELEVPTTYGMYAGNYEAAINAAYTEVVGGRG